MISTVIYDTTQQSFPAPLTTPDCLTLAEKQQQMVKAGCKYMVIEASSHSLCQGRLAAIDFKAAAFTNLAGDHMDYHNTEENYLLAKSRLFSNLSPDATAILNKQSVRAGKIAQLTTANILWYAIGEPADLVATIKSMDISGTDFILEYKGRVVPVRTALLGQYNISNQLAAAGLCLAAGLDLADIAEGLSDLSHIPGRLEKIDHPSHSVIIDYAHTDDALKNVLSTLKPLSPGRLIVLFGCGGDRDKTKRQRMAKVAEQLADVIVVTSDNPRTEKPEDIIQDIVAGFAKPNSNKIAVEPDRKKAIQLAIEYAKPDDIVLLAGKGHEDYQIIGKEKFAFSDKEIARQYLAKIR